MFALCFEERILSSRSAVLKAGPGSSWCQAWPIGTLGKRASLIGCLSGHIVCLLSTHSRRAITQIGGTDPQVDVLYVVCFSLGERVFASK